MKEKSWVQAFQEGKKELVENMVEIKALQKQSGFPAVAFVTFESWETAQNVRRAFGGNYIRRNFCPPAALRMKGKRLQLSDHITQPTDVLWENLGVSERSLHLRRLATNALSFMILMLSFILMYMIEIVGGVFEKLCTDEVAMTCDVPLPNATVPQLHGDAFSESWSAPDATGSDIECLCSPALFEYSLIVTGANLVYLKTGLVVALNLILESLLTYFVTSIERHPSVDAQQESLFYKLLMVEYINTAAIMFLVSANSVNAAVVVLLKVIGIQDFLASELMIDETALEILPELEAGWFDSVGVSFCMALLINGIVTNLSTLSSYYVVRLKRRCCWDHHVSQDELNDLFTPEPINMIDRSVHKVNCMVCAMFLSGSIPVLVPIVLFDMIVQYAIDRLWFYKVYGTPGHVSGRVSRAVIKSLQRAVYAHCILTVWAFAKAYLPSDTHTLFNTFVTIVEVNTTGTSAPVSLRRALRGGGGRSSREGTSTQNETAFGAHNDGKQPT